ncbi:hypothetical protein ACJJIU_00265 [Microbulbifer sp. CnH-101-E]|uniref:hypothetical protein n=1 Tax=unclassified Microbulbifer TaxID=2619833 RepID=UPI00403A632D
MKLKSGLAGRFKIEAYKRDASGAEIPGSRRVAAPWFSNLILNQGLDKWAGGQDIKRVCHVGAGSSTPAVTDTGLNSPLAYTEDRSSLTNGLDNSGAPFVWGRSVFAFGEGEAAGNLAEIGVGWGTNHTDLFSRTLITDAQGNPTSLTVLPDEYLDVTYELRIYIPTEDAVGTVALGGIVYDWRARPSNADFNSTSHPTAPGWGLASPRYLSSASPLAYDGNIGDMYSRPSGNSDSTSSNNVEVAPYVDGSFEAVWTVTYTPDKANFATGIRSVEPRLGFAGWQIEFSAQGSGDAIPKTSDKALVLTLTQSFHRVAV